jgi:hypothetical protein
MAVVLLAGPGASPPENPSTGAWLGQALPRGETRFTVVLPEARSAAQAALQEVVVEYPSASPRWRLGASLFAGLRLASRNENTVAPHLAASVDAVVVGVGAVTLGGETSFSRSASLSLGLQRGDANSWLSYYLGGAALLTFDPSPNPGFELRLGGRAVYLPLDLAVQTHPWVTPGQGHVARYRLILGVRLGI